ncbi:hypothetical protein MYA_0847 [Burkholderia sp. KJ006]|nr:hypothetical protein MYA_0847 [Burkholderia sp. KJ006]
MLTGIVAAVGRIESRRPLGAPDDADACVRLTVHAGGLHLPRWRTRPQHRDRADDLRVAEPAPGLMRRARARGRPMAVGGACRHLAGRPTARTRRRVALRCNGSGFGATPRTGCSLFHQESFPCPSRCIRLRCPS